MKLCVILPVYNAEAYLPAALRSLVAQTFADFKIIAVNDCSSDKSGQILDIFAACELRAEVVHLAQNTGENNVMHYLLDRAAQSGAEYTALMHHDDVCLPERFAKQIAFLDSHPNINILGTRVMITDADGNDIRECNIALEDSKIKANMAAASGNLMHPTTMWRTDFFRQHHIRYGETIPGDFDMWADCAIRGAAFANLPDVLLRYRTHDKQQSTKKDEINATVQKALERYLRVVFPALPTADIQALAALCRPNGQVSSAQAERAERAFNSVKHDTARSILGEDRKQMMANIQAKIERRKKRTSSATVTLVRGRKTIIGV
ncbi:glycosyltransferase family 2 protein [Neisseria perflava]|uniref:glycosyltransferase family 2 protein n=1 Tax=Neisseria perflava TaxID=33053 RepID=UPI00209CD436|nr:glycosyltransferase family 2 protein [Neisseria perflava]MCP1660462.1 glycosyltransferase involved in cell wall biosynthesis [Neisseria perflava]MCP1772010.1 glycosyltransferase involved in cell wall biosynthesis [Neisseria perflava]